MIGIISDIHGNYPALQAVLEKLDAKGCKRIISLGDVSGYYCMINECIQELKNRDIPNILGNHDFYIVNNKECGRSYTVNQCLNYQRKILSEENFEWLKKSYSDIKENGIWMVHGGWNDYIDEYISTYDFLEKSDVETKLFVSGHTHIQKKIEGQYACYINPGSVGQPRDYVPSAAYAVVNDDGSVELLRTEYDIDKICYEMKMAGFQERVFSCLYQGTKIGEQR